MEPTDNGEEWDLLTGKEKESLEGWLNHPGLQVFQKILEERKKNLNNRLYSLEDQVKIHRFQGRAKELQQIWKIIEGQLERMSKEEQEQIRRENEREEVS